jgi:hypothetical protein
MEWRKRQTLDFPGSTHCCRKTRPAKFMVLRLTSVKRLRAGLQAVKQELRRRMHLPVAVQASTCGQWWQSMVGTLAFRGMAHAFSAVRFQETRLWHRCAAAASSSGSRRGEITTGERCELAGLTFPNNPLILWTTLWATLERASPSREFSRAPVECLIMRQRKLPRNQGLARLLQSSDSTNGPQHSIGAAVEFCTRADTGEVTDWADFKVKLRPSSCSLAGSGRRCRQTLGSVAGRRRRPLRVHGATCPG